MNNNILAIVGIGEAGLPVINKSKEMGIKTVGFGMKDSLGKNLVDIFEEINIFDIKGMVKACKKHKVTGVIGPSEISAEPAAYLANELGLPGNRVEGGFFARNKYLMRKKVSEIGTILQPEYCLYEKGMEIKYPVVVKALDSCGKQGITLVKSEKELNKAVTEAEKISSNGKALIEGYLDGGKEYSVECLSFNGKYKVIQITEKDSSGPPHFAEIGHHQPANISNDMKKNIEITAEKILKVIGIDCGMAHLEIKIIDEKIYFIEVGARAGGDHIADRLIYLSTDCDYYRAAIECSLNIFENIEVKNVGYSGIYFYCKKNEELMPLFNIARNAKWCVENKITYNELKNVESNIEAVNEGYFIYSSDHKIDIKDAKIYKPIVLNNYKNAYEMMWKHNREIGRTLSDKELDEGIKKFIKKGNVISILDNEHIIALLNLYCNNYETLEAYICNVYVLEKFRGLGLSTIIVKEAISICKEKNFKTIKLHVAEDNYPAINLYKKLGFIFNGNERITSNEKELEMILEI